jgi:hypothetical protein
MSGFRQLTATGERRAPATVMFPPSGFSDEYQGRPDTPVEIGIRRVSSDTTDTARAWAAKKAARRHPNMTSADTIWCEAFNEALMQWIVARATCKPDDVNASFWACAEDVVPLALSAAGLLRLWEEHEMLCIGQGVLSPEVDLDECELMGLQLQSGELFAKMKPNQVRYAKRLLARVMEVAGHEVGATVYTQGVVL